MVTATARAPRARADPAPSGERPCVRRAPRTRRRSRPRPLPGRRGAARVARVAGRSRATVAVTHQAHLVVGALRKQGRNAGSSAMASTGARSKCGSRSLPTVGGEHCVLHLRDRSRQRMALHELGMTPGVCALYTELAQSPSGMIVVSGPARSGKTTTMFATLDAFDPRRPQRDDRRRFDRPRRAGRQPVPRRSRCRSTSLSGLGDRRTKIPT